MNTEAELQNLDRSIAENRGTRNWVTTLQNALIVTRREVRDSFRDWRIIIPIFLLTLVFPLLANLASGLFTGLIRNSGQQDPEGITEALLPLMPMLVGFFPISMSLVIALETFVGEKERMSLEPLLSTPLTNTELYIGKVLSSIIPPLTAGYLGIAIYVTGQIVGSLQWRPSAVLILQIVLLTAIQATVMVTGSVVISSQTTSTRAANLLASAVIIPMSMLVIIESVIMIQPNYRSTLWIIMIGLLVVIALLLRMGARIFNREELLGRAIDHINIPWAFRTFIQQWTGGVSGFRPIAWYRLSVWPAIVNLRRAMVAYVVCAIMIFVVGWLLRDRYTLPLAEAGLTKDELNQNLLDAFGLARKEPRYLFFAIAQNLRLIIGGTLLSAFTFGVIGLIFTTLPFGFMGYLLANANAEGIDTLPFLAVTMPHSLASIPALMLMGAATLQLGAVITRPPGNMTVGEAWIRQLADTLKVCFAVVMPFMIVAALLEVYITPHVIEWAF